MPENKIFYGLSMVHIAPIIDMQNGEPTYGTPFHFPGAVSWGEAPEGENNPFRADNSDYYISAGNDGYTGDLEVARVIDEFNKKIYGMQDGTNGELIEIVQGEAVPFGMVLQIEGDKSATRYCYPYCTAERASADHSTTEEGAIEPGTETIPISCKPLEVNNVTIAKWRIPKDSPKYTSILETFELPEIESEISA